MIYPQASTTTEDASALLFGFFELCCLDSQFCVAEVVGVGQGEVQLWHLVQLDPPTLDIEAENMFSGIERARNEMQVESWNPDVTEKRGREKPYQGSGTVLEDVGGLASCGLHELGALGLSHDASHLDPPEVPFGPNPVKVVEGRHQLHYSFLELFHVVRVFQVFGIFRYSSGHRRKRRANFIGNNVGVALGVRAVDHFVKHHELPIKLVEGAPAEVTAFPQFADRDVAMVHAVQHRPDR